MVARISRTIAMRPSQTTSRVIGSSPPGAGPDPRTGVGVLAPTPALADAPAAAPEGPDLVPSDGAGAPAGGAGKGLGSAHASPLSINRSPESSTRKRHSGGTTVVAPSSSTIAGPAWEAPAGSRPRSSTGVSKNRPPENTARVSTRGAGEVSRHAPRAERGLATPADPGQPEAHHLGLAVVAMPETAFVGVVECGLQLRPAS